MVEGKSWLARVARRLGELVTGPDDGTALTGDDLRHPSRSGPDQASSTIQHDGDPAARLARIAKMAAAQASVASDPLADSPYTAPMSRSAATEPAIIESPSLPEGVTLSESGRFIVGGYSYSTLEQAKGQARLAAATHIPLPPLQPARSMEQRPSPTKSARVVPGWIGEMTVLQVGDHKIATDLVYFGTPQRHENQHDQSRIDPSLRIDTMGDRYGATLDYWPSYRRLDPRARWTYLNWLDGGRTDPATPIGYVFLFFYGLEQRLFIDDARDEAGVIMAEVRRLLDIYGENYSFASYAQKLLALKHMYHEDEIAPPTAASAATFDLELPLDVRIRLGRRLRDDQPFDADDTLHWVLALPDVYLRTPGQRCFDELRALWSHRFAARHPDGLRIRRPRKTISSDYRAASSAFSCSVTIDLPDIAGTSAPLTPLRAMFDSCMDDLAAYSRLLGRDPEARGRLRGDLLLPAELHHGRASLVEGKAALGQLAEQGEAATLTVYQVAQALEIDLADDADKIPAAIARQMCNALDALHFGCEPDRRYGPAAALRTSGPLILFTSQGGGAVDHERPAYASARVMVEISVLAAASDGEVSTTELKAIERRLLATPELVEHEVARLMACAKALAADPPKVRAALKKLTEVPSAQRAALAASAVDAVLADGRVLPEEVRFLEALHAALSLPASDLYSALHRSGDDDGPVEVVQGQSDRDVPIAPETTANQGLAIDMARLERIRGETNKVSAMLAQIFVEEEPEAAPPPKRTSAASDTQFAGLDGAHSELLKRLIVAPLGRSEFDDLAGKLRLMPDGAIETLNEWGFDTFGEPLVDDDENIRISPDILKQLEPMGVFA